MPAEPVSVSLYETKTHLSEFGERAAEGEIIIVTKHGRPRFRLVALEPTLPPRAPGGNFMEITYVADDFDAPDEELERLFGMRD